MEKMIDKHLHNSQNHNEIMRENNLNNNKTTPSSKIQINNI